MEGRSLSWASFIAVGAACGRQRRRARAGNVLAVSGDFVDPLRTTDWTACHRRREFLDGFTLIVGLERFSASLDNVPTPRSAFCSGRGFFGSTVPA